MVRSKIRDVVTTIRQMEYDEYSVHVSYELIRAISSVSNDLINKYSVSDPSSRTKILACRITQTTTSPTTSPTPASPKNCVSSSAGSTPSPKMKSTVTKVAKKPPKNSETDDIDEDKLLSDDYDFNSSPKAGNFPITTDCIVLSDIPYEFCFL